MQRLIDEGLANGPSEGFDVEDFLSDMRAAPAG